MERNPVRSATLDAEFSLASYALRKRDLRPSAVVALWLDVWGCPRVEKRTDGGDSPGDHGIEEIGRQELAFYRTLTDPQRDALTSIRSIVDEMYSQGRGWQGVDPWKIGAPIDEWKAKAVADLATHPMQAFMIGQMLANEAIGRGLARPLLPTDKRAIEFLEHYAFSEIDDAFERLKGSLRTELISGMDQGLNPTEVARRISRSLEDYKTDWATIAITETSRAEAQGRLREMEDESIVSVRGSSAHDSRTCEKCLALLSEKVYPVKSVIGVSNYGRKREDWVACIPLHPRCRCVWAPVWED